jgi:hypothetical protein
MDWELLGAMVKKIGTRGLFGCALMLVSVSVANAQQTAVSSPLIVQLRLQVSDALSNTVPDNRFVEGEQLFVKVVLSAPEVLDAIAELDRASLRVSILETSGEKAKLSEARAALVTSQQTHDRLLAELTDQAVLDVARKTVTLEIYSVTGATHVITKTASVPRLVTSRVEEVNPNPTVRQQIWELPKDGLGTGNWQISGAAGEHAAPYAVMFEIVPSIAATPAERSRALYVHARVARDQENTAGALELAQTAISVGAPLSYDVMSAYALTGDLYSDRDELQLAVNAYEQAIAIAETAFPTSRLPEILRRKIQVLEARLEELEK